MRKMVSVAEHGSTLKKSRLASAFRIRNFSKNSSTKVSFVKMKLILVTLGSAQSISSGETTCSREPDRSTTSPGLSSLTTSTRGNTWITPTDIGLVVEDSKEEEEVEVDEDEDEHEGRVGRGGREVEEDKEVGRDRKDMTNLMKAKSFGS